MSPLPADPLATAALAAAAAYFMTTVGVGKKLLAFRVKTCPVCHNPKTRCTCRWL